MARSARAPPRGVTPRSATMHPFYEPKGYVHSHAARDAGPRAASSPSSSLRAFGHLQGVVHVLLPNRRRGLLPQGVRRYPLKNFFSSCPGSRCRHCHQLSSHFHASFRPLLEQPVLRRALLQALPLREVTRGSDHSLTPAVAARPPHQQRAAAGSPGTQVPPKFSRCSLDNSVSRSTPGDAALTVTRLSLVVMGRRAKAPSAPTARPSSASLGWHEPYPQMDLI